MPNTRVLLVENHLALRQGLTALFSGESDIEIVGVAENGRQALRRVAALCPDLVLVDLSMPGLNGIQTTRQIRQLYPQVKVVVLSLHSDEEYIFQALQAGAAGYVLKQSGATELLAAIRMTIACGSFLSSAISQTVLEAYARRAKARGRGNKELRPGNG